MDAAVERRMGSDRETRVQPLHLRFLSSSVSLGFPSFAYGRLRRGVEWIVRGTERMTTRGGNSRPRVVCFQVNHHVGFSFHSSPCHNPSFPHHPSHRPPKGTVSEGNEGGSVVVSPSPHLTLSSFGSVRFCCHSTSPGSLGSLATLVSRREPTRCAERKGRRGTRQREPGNSQINPEIAAFVTSNDK